MSRTSDSQSRVPKRTPAPAAGAEQGSSSAREKPAFTTGDQAPDLRLGGLRTANAARCLRWHPGGVASWPVEQWFAAMVGEVGELGRALPINLASSQATPALAIVRLASAVGSLASLAKMRQRQTDGLGGNKVEPSEALVAQALADAGEALSQLGQVMGVEPRQTGQRLDDGDATPGAEAADVLLYLDLLCESQGVDLSAATVAKFDATSARFGFPERLGNRSGHVTVPQELVPKRLDSLQLSSKVWKLVALHEAAGAPITTDWQVTKVTPTGIVRVRRCQEDRSFTRRQLEASAADPTSLPAIVDNDQARVYNMFLWAIEALRVPEELCAPPSLNSVHARARSMRRWSQQAASALHHLNRFHGDLIPPPWPGNSADAEVNAPAEIDAKGRDGS